jgi:hypothetical protein
MDVPQGRHHPLPSLALRAPCPKVQDARSGSPDGTGMFREEVSCSGRPMQLAKFAIAKGFIEQADLN